MEKTYHSLKDFELSYGKNAIERANDFQQYIEQLNDFGCKSYWITSHTGIGSTMAIEGFNEPVIAFISNDYLGMSKREETKQATDHEEYFLWVLDHVARSGLFSRSGWEDDEFFYPRTDFQLQWESMGKPIYRARFIKLQKA